MTNKLKVLILKESAKNENRVAATLETVRLLVKLGLDVTVESGAGEKSYIIDRKYDEAGASIKNDQMRLLSNADIILSVNHPKKKQIKGLKEKSIWISMMDPYSDAEVIKELLKHKVTFFSLNLLPRITRAQKMDVLTSQSNISGYKAVIIAADYLGKMFPLMMTASGTIHPAKVLILGAGVAGLQAIATAKRLGAQVEVSDVRPNVKEQVESLGANFIEVPFDKDIEDKSGYAKEASKEFLKKQSDEVTKRIKFADVVITTALITGKKAPILITGEMVKSMEPGSVIVDLAAQQGGNCELTKQDKITNEFGVTIIGLSNIPAKVPVHSSEMYSKNVLYFLTGLIKDGKISLDMDDEVYKECLITHEGNFINDKVANIVGGQKNG